MWLAETAGASGNMLLTLLPFVLMFAIFYFLLIRPQQRKQKERNNMLRSLNKGDKVTTIGGLHGTIVEITDDTVVLKVNDVTKLTFDRSAINTVQARAAEPKADKSEKNEKSDKDK
jgi:preprotein translocase subunit YajC